MSTRARGETESEVSEQHVQFSTTVGYFDSYMEALEAFREEGIVVFRDAALFSKVTDPANVAMCVSKIEGQALNAFSIEKAEELEAGINFTHIRDCLKGVSSTSELQVTWPVVRGSSRLIELNVIDEDLQFEIPTVNPDTVPDIPQNEPLSHPTRVVVGGSQLKKSVKHAGKIAQAEGASVIFETFDGVLQLRASDQVDGNFTKQFHQSGPSDGDGLSENQSEIALTYMEDVKSLLGRGDEVKIHIAQDKPVRFDVKLDDDGDAEVIYLIAPRIDSQ